MVLQPAFVGPPNARPTVGADSAVAPPGLAAADAAPLLAPIAAEGSCSQARIGTACAVGATLLLATSGTRRRCKANRRARRQSRNTVVATCAAPSVIEETAVDVEGQPAEECNAEDVGITSCYEGEPAPERGLITLLVAAAYVIWQMDKVNMSVAIIPMAQQFGWDAGDQGLIQSSIFWGYASTQVLGGFLATKYGGKRVLLAAVTLWSAATMLAPLAASMGTTALVASRVLVGIGEGLAPAAGLSMVATWTPAEERSRAVAFLGGGKTLGAIVGLILAPFIIANFGWPVMFYGFGVLGLGWGIVWSVLGKDRERPADTEDVPIPWKRIITTPALWGVVAAHFCHDWGSYALLTWTPTYLNKALGFNLEGSSELTVIPSLCAVAVAGFAGTAADNLKKEGWELTTVRKLFQNAAFVIPGIALTWLGLLDGVEPGSPLPIVLLTAGIASGALSYAGLYSSHADLNAKYSGLVNGVSTTFGALAGVCSNAFAGYMLKTTGSYAQAIFLPSVFMYAVGFVLYTALYDATPIDWDKEEAEAEAAAKQ